LSSLKAELLHALQETHPDGRLASGLALPTEASDIIFGKAKDVHDLTRGWERISTNELGSGDAEGAKKKKTANPEDSPKGLGLKNGAALAYKFKSEEIDLDEGLGLEDDDEKWDVIIATYEENEDGIPRLPIYSE